MDTVMAIGEQEKRTANINSITTAKLGTVVAGMFSGKNSKRAEIQDFLPFEFDFPQDNKSLEIKTTQRPTKETKKLFWKLIKKGNLPSNVISAFMGELR